MKKVITLLLAVWMICSLAACSGEKKENTDKEKSLFVAEEYDAFAGMATDLAQYELTGSCGENLQWGFDEESGDLFITGTGSMDNYENPYPKVTFSAPWWDFQDQIFRVFIDDGVTTIGNQAFRNCSYIACIRVPDGVTYIGNQAFCNCNNLDGLYLPKTMETIRHTAFANCDSLTDVYYGGTQEEWADMEIEDNGNEELFGANIHYEQ